jgi:predicted nucleotidyltransferase
MTLLQERDLARREHRLRLYAETRHALQAALADLIPGRTVILFGSLTKPGVFNDHSDIDLALDSEPPQASAWHLASVLAERLGRPVDIVLLGKSRFREKILREGEKWTA